MIGTIVNVAAIVVGITCGSRLGIAIKEEYKRSLFDGLGLCCIVLGVNAVVQYLPQSPYPVLFILAIAIGGVIGTVLHLDRRVQSLSNHNPGAMQGLATGVLLFCIGTFSIVGPIMAALSPTRGWALSEAANTFLYTNATLDLVTSAVLAASYGRIMYIAAPILFCWQGLFYGVTLAFSRAIPEPMRADLCVVGGVLILSSGLSILNINDCKTINMLPSLVVPVVFYLIRNWLFG